MNLNMKKTILTSPKMTVSTNPKKGKTYSEITTGTKSEDSMMSEQAVAYKQQAKKTIDVKEQTGVAPQIIYGQILEIDKNSVILRCLVDEDEGLFQKRRFDRQFFEGAVNLVINQLVEVKVYIRQGEVKFTFANSNRQNLAEKFAPKDYFSEFEGSILFQPLAQPLHIDADNF